MNFFVWLNDQQQGPFDEKNIRRMLSERKITQTTLVCPEGGDLDWTPVGELLLEDSIPESFAPLPSISEISFEQSDDGSRLQIWLSSGVDLKIKAVRLYDEKSLDELNAKKAEAMKMFKGVSTGLGSWGSIEWVLAASAVIGAAEAVLSAGAASAGARLLEEVIQAERKLRKEGIFLPVSKIQNIENPIPGFWRMLLRTGKDIPITSSAFVHNGDDFISLMGEDDRVSSIRLSAVERYVHLKTNY